MRYICAQPGELYFCWQIDVMIHSFINVGIEQEKIDIIFSDFKKDIEYYLELKHKYPEVNFHIYPDTRKDIKYISSIRPHILKKHFKKHWWKYRGTFLYHDCDIVLTKPLDLGAKISGCDPYNYLSNTKSYIGYEYILSKGKDVLNLMCEIADIDKKVLKENQDNSGGAQYLLKDIDAEFWEKVEIDCENLYYNVFRLNNKKKKQNKEYHPLQIWCADMWAVLWNLWKINKQTRIAKEMNFTWAGHPIKQWKANAIYHNAGVIKAENKEFQKGLFRKQKPPKDLDINPELACYEYYQLVKQIL
jgi:hypothetical protein